MNTENSKQSTQTSQTGAGQQQRSTVQTVEEYRCRITLPNKTFSLTTNNVKDLQADLVNLLGEQTRFETQEGTSNVLVFHPQYNTNREPIGWIQVQTVPATLSIKAITDARQAAQAQRAA